MNSKKSLFFVLLAVTLATLLVASCAPPAGAPAPAEEAQAHPIPRPLKNSGVPPVKRPDEGGRPAGPTTRPNTYHGRPTHTHPDTPVKMVEDLVAKGVDAIGVVPNDAQSMEPVFDKAKDKGIIVLTHESPDQVGNDYDLELIDNVKFGQHHWDKLVEFMGDSGEFAVYVGSLTVPLHNLWADEGLKYAAEKYPNLKLVTERIPCGEDQELSRQKMVELLKAYPDLKGMVGFGSLGPPGAAQALEEKELCEQVAIVGTVLPDHAAPYLKNGCMDWGILWDPKDAGYGMVWLAKHMLDGGQVSAGIEIPGLGAAELDGTILKFDAMIDITAETVDSFGF
ncbi:MAG: substrate-binding domain-containing protein [Chloroflexi bacterium]|nr:substrate-binding domain-containing protein [Chloroflexota bacterium]